MFIGCKLERMHFEELAHCPRNLTKFEWDVLHKEHSYSFFVHHLPQDIIVLKQINKDIIRQLQLLRNRQTLAVLCLRSTVHVINYGESANIMHKRPLSQIFKN